MRSILHRLSCAVSILVASHGSPALADVPVVTSLTISSQSGDPIGGGQDYEYNADDGTFTVSPYATDGLTAVFESNDHATVWELGFVAADGAPLVPGSYPDARTFPFAAPGQPGLLVTTRAASCSVQGSFEIKLLDRADDGSITALWVTFEQRCLESEAGLIGELRYNVPEPLRLEAPLTVQAADHVELAFDVTAVAQEPVTIAVEAAPSGATFEDRGNGTSTFRWTPARSDTGEHTVHFVARTLSGLTQSAATRITVIHENRPPVADAGGPYHTTVNTIFTLTGPGTSDPDSDALQYSWSFGDGRESSEATPRQSYYSAGVYLVTLTVTDPSSASSTDTTHVIVDSPAFGRAFVAGGQSILRLGAGKPELCVQTEPYPGYYENESVSGPFRLYLAGPLGQNIEAISVTRGEDRDHNGVEEIGLCFRKEDLRDFFFWVDRKTTVSLVISASLPTPPDRIEAGFLLDVIPAKETAQARLERDPDGTNRLSFETPVAGVARVAIYDLAGRRVANSVDAAAAPAGAREVSLGKGLSPGVYFYRIETPGLTQSGRFVILR